MCSTYLSIILKLIRIVYKLSITSCCDELATAFISFVSNTMTDAIRPSQGKQWHQNLSLGSKFQSRVLKIPPTSKTRGISRLRKFLNGVTTEAHLHLIVTSMQQNAAYITLQRHWHNTFRTSIRQDDEVHAEKCRARSAFITNPFNENPCASTSLHTDSPAARPIAMEWTRFSIQWLVRCSSYCKRKSRSCCSWPVASK